MKRILLILGLVVLLMAACEAFPIRESLLGGDEPDAIGAGWIVAASMPTPRSELVATAWAGRVYVAGGIGESWTTRDEFEAYDITNDRWETLSPLPVGLHHTAITVLDGMIYVTGGYADMLFVANQRTTYRYDTTSDTWSQATAMPGARAAHSMVALDGQVYVVGGAGDRPHELWRYDPASDSWETLPAALPTLREHLTAVALEGRLYVIGGRWSRGNLPTLESYDPATNTWQSHPDMPTPRGGLTAGVVNGRIHVTGGEAFGPDRTFDQHEVYDPASDSWTTLPAMPTARHGLASIGYEGRWYVIGGGREAGGQTAATLTTALEIYTPAGEP